MRVSVLFALLGAVLVSAYAPETAAPSAPRDVAPVDTVWTWPERSENLQVLPDSTSADELQAVMQSFTRALGVRCGSCHVGQGRDFRTWDFASDAKGHKEVARGMMRMTMALNESLVPEALGAHSHGESGGGHSHAAGHSHSHDAEPEHAELHVSCWTCHRGQSHPETVAPERP